MSLVASVRSTTPSSPQSYMSDSPLSISTITTYIPNTHPSFRQLTNTPAMSDQAFQPRKRSLVERLQQLVKSLANTAPSHRMLLDRGDYDLTLGVHYVAGSLLNDHKEGMKRVSKSYRVFGNSFHANSTLSRTILSDSCHGAVR